MYSNNSGLKGTWKIKEKLHKVESKLKQRSHLVQKLVFFSVLCKHHKDQDLTLCAWRKQYINFSSYIPAGTSHLQY
jgi:hypothetical protein